MKTILQHRGKIFGILSFLLLVYIVKTVFLSKPEFIILHQMTKADASNGSTDEIILIKNPPKYSTELTELITDFNFKRNLQNDNITQLFIKEHNSTFLPDLFLSENYSYADPGINRSKLDNADFLASRTKYINANKKAIDSIRCFIGEHNYLKE